MSNLGFHRAMQTLGIETVVTDVGDRYVLEAMRARGAVLGGEQSGHVIALDYQTTGDGLDHRPRCCSRRSTAPARAAGARPRRSCTRFPQRLVNVRANREGLADCTRDLGASSSARARRSTRAAPGRIVLRASGTEPLVRVMVEHEDAEELDRLCA